MYRLRDITIAAVPSYRKKTRRFFESHRQFFIRSCEFENSKVYVDGTKSVRRAELFANYSDLPFKIIHLVRDGRGFCLSFLQNNQLPRRKLAEAAKSWLEYIELIDTLSFRHPSLPLMTLRYEDLCENPEQTLSAVCEFLEIPFDNTMMKGTNKPYHVLGHGMRKTFDGKIRQNLSWQRKFTSDEIDKITDLMKRGLQRFGYV
ncbi:MAG: sulfotransferase [Candidatus Hodarchaeota archaeon]